VEEVDIDLLRDAIHDAPEHEQDFEEQLGHSSAVADDTKRQFYSVARGIMTMFEAEHELDYDDNVEAIRHFPDDLRMAIETIREARTGVDRTPPCAGLTGLERKTRLDDAMLHLWPILSLALHTEFQEARPVYDQIEALIGELREQIDRDILLEDRIGEPPIKDMEEDEEDGEPPEEPPPS
jgi:hypothetical protein